MRETPVGYRGAVGVVAAVVKENGVREPIKAPAQKAPRRMHEGIHRETQAKLNGR